MPERAQFLSIVALYAANVLVPAASFVMSVRTALASGRRAGFAVAFGLAAADIANAASAVLGARGSGEFSAVFDGARSEHRRGGVAA
jgi:threonine/homoserine/homoserine lactone efflux protein